MPHHHAVVWLDHSEAHVMHIHAHDHGLIDKVVGVETVDHPTDGQLVAYARKVFLAKGQMPGTA